jgi:hypothetical protein
MTRSEGFVECRKNPRFAGDRRDAVPVQVGPQVKIHACEDQSNVLAGQLVEQIANRLRRGEIDIRNRPRIDDKPADR